MISVIVPVHNTEKYLDKCIQSIACQTYKNVEIICIDSSSDSSGRILESWSHKDKRVKIIHDANGSYGHKLNVGISEATGEYLSIIDSDDFMAEDMLESLLKVIEGTDLDYVKSDYSRFHEEEGKVQIDEYSKCLTEDSYYNKIIKVEQFPEIMLKSNICIWTGLYRASFLRENQILLHESSGASFQDCGFAVLTILLAKKVFYVPQSFYRYRIDNAGSSVKDESKMITIIEEWKWIIKSIEDRGKYTGNAIFNLKAKKIVTYYWNYVRLKTENANYFAKQIHEELKKEYISSDQYKEFNFEIREMIFSMYKSNDEQTLIDKNWTAQEGINIFYTKPDSVKCSVVIWEDDKYSGGNWEKTLLSILRQDVIEMEIWLLVSKCDATIQKYQRIDTRIKVLECGDGLGIWKQCNFVIPKFEGEYAFFMTNTERLYDGALKTLIELTEKYNYDLLFFDAEVFDKEPYDYAQLPYLSYYKHEVSYGNISSRECMQKNMLKEPWCDLVLPILVRKNLIWENEISFGVNVISNKRYFEAKLITCAGKIFQINDRLMCKEVDYLRDLRE